MRQLRGWLVWYSRSTLPSAPSRGYDEKLSLPILEPATPIQLKSFACGPERSARPSGFSEKEKRGVYCSASGRMTL